MQQNKFEQQHHKYTALKKYCYITFNSVTQTCFEGVTLTEYYDGKIYIKKWILPIYQPISVSIKKHLITANNQYATIPNT